MSGSKGGDPEVEEPADGALDLLKFFHALSPAARREYEALAKRDVAFGEDVAAERRARDGSASGA